MTKDFVSDQIDDYRIEDEAQEQEEYAKIYQKIEDISTGGGVDLSPYLKIEDASANFAEKSELEAKADRVDVYTKEETDEKFATKDEVETGLSGKANVGTSYTKAESDEKYLTEHQDISNLATKEEVETGLSGKANVGASYTKAESDEKYLTEHQDISNLATKAEVAEKANITDVYTKEQADAKFITEHQDISNLATKAEVAEVEEKIPDVSAFVTEDTVDEKIATEIAKVVADAPEDFDTLKEVADYIASDKTKAAEIETAISNLQAEDTVINETLAGKADANAVYTKAEADEKFITEHQDISNLATKAEVAEKADANTVYTKEQADAKFLTEHQDISGLATKTEVENGLAEKADADAVYTKEQADAKFLTEHQDISNLATKDEVAAGDNAVKDEIYGKMWNKSGDYFQTKYTKNGKTAMLWNESDGGGAIFETSDLKSFVGVNDGGTGAGDVNVQIYSKTKSNNTGARLNVNTTGIYYGVGSSAVLTPETELAVKGDIPSV